MNFYHFHHSVFWV